MALIELDLTDRPDTAPRLLPPARRYRFSGLILAAVLTFALGGAVPDLPGLWRYLGSVPAPGGPDAPFQVTGGRIVTMNSDGVNRVATAWAAGDPPRRLWTTRFPTRVIGPDQVGFGAVEIGYTTLEKLDEYLRRTR